MSDDMSDEGGWSEGSEENNNNEDAEVENQFFEAEEERDKNPTEALRKFIFIIQHEENLDTKNNSFKSLKYAFKIQYNLKLLDDSLETFKNILKFSKYVTFNEISAAVTDILDMLTRESGKVEHKQIENIIHETLQFFKKNNNYELLFKVQTIQIDQYFSIDKIDDAKNLLQEIEKSDEQKQDPIFNSDCQIEADKTTKIQFMMQQLELQAILKDDKNLMLKTIALKHRLGEIQDVRIKSRLHQLQGLIHLKLKCWARAQHDFTTSFQNQATRGDRKSSVAMLVRALVCNVLAFEEIDMSNTNEVNVQKEDVAELITLKKLSVNQDVRRFLECLDALDPLKYASVLELKDDLKLEQFHNVVLQLSKKFSDLNLSTVLDLFRVPKELREVYVKQVVAYNLKIDWTNQKVTFIHSQKRTLSQEICGLCKKIMRQIEDNDHVSKSDKYGDIQNISNY